MGAMKIKNSVCFVTGANRGIGKSFVEELFYSGAAKIYAAARDITNLDDLVLLSPDKIIPVELDVTKSGNIESAANLASDTQILINNAGISEYSAIIAAKDITSARYEMEVNYFGLLNMTRSFAPIVEKSSGGVIVNISSIGGLIGIPMIGTYCATKAAVHSLTQSVRGELAKKNTLVIGVYPGPIDTEMSRGVDFEKEPPSAVAKETIDAIENGKEDVYPDKIAKQTCEGLKANAKLVEKQWAETLPQESVQ